MNLVIASDHAGFAYKTLLLKDLLKWGFEVVDLGTYNEIANDDYPDQAQAVALEILNKQAERGILICGSGVGVSVAANKFRGIRAGVCHDTYSAHQCVEHDNVNVLCMGERIIGIELAREIVSAFLKAVYSKEPRHERRLAKIEAIENKNREEIKP